MPYTVPELTYPKNALEPHIDALTMEIHHDKHHAAYVTNLNKALEGAGVVSTDEDLQPQHRNGARRSAPPCVTTAAVTRTTAVRTVMSPRGGGEPSGPLAEAIKNDLGGFAAFKEAFSNAGATRFGSGWAWLSVEKGGKLVVESTPNQDNPWMEGRMPILGMDVWEHAYYLKYQNRRPEYIGAFWNVVDWMAVGERFVKAKG
jgi:Fe-Mn family superoxide dismutase